MSFPYQNQKSERIEKKDKQGNRKRICKWNKNKHFPDPNVIADREKRIGFLI